MDKKVFISHSQKDKAIADIICDALEKESIGCWIAPRNIPYGNDWTGEITRAIENCAIFVFLFLVRTLMYRVNAQRKYRLQII